MKQRNIGIVLLLSFVTLGIYTVVWTYKTRKEMVTYLQNEKAIRPFWWILAPYILLIGVAILALIASAAHAGQSDDGSNLFVVLVGFAAVIGTIVIPFWWFISYFRALDAVTGEKEFGLNYSMWVVSLFFGIPVWTLLVQNSLNKKILRMHEAQTTARSTDSSSPTPPAPPVSPITPANPTGL